jgi:hypothetical protein
MKMRSLDMRIYMKVNRARIKSAALSIAVLCALSLSSCSFIPGYTEPEDQYIISALGFDQEGGELVVSAQTSSEEGEVLDVYRGRGESVEYAMAHLEGTDARRIELGHCAMILIGESISPERLAEILDYCRRNDDVTVSAGVGAAHNAFELLSHSRASGYSLIRAMRQGEDGSGVSVGSRFYAIEDVRASEKRAGVFSLPYFVLGENTWSLWGLRLFRNCEALTLLDRGESAIYTMLCGRFGGGTADVTVNGVGYSALFRSCKRRVKLDGDTIVITCDVLLDRETRPRVDEESLMSAMSQEAEGLCRQLMERYGDVFGIAAALGCKGEDLNNAAVKVVFE